jgi:zinc protease
MIVAGDVTPEEVFALAEKYFGPIPAVPQPKEEITQEPAQIGERRVSIKKFGQTPLLEMAFHTGTADDKDAETRDLLVDILSSGESSRLYRRLVDQDRVAIGAGAFVNPEGFDPGLIKFTVTVAPDKTLAAAETALLDELAKIAATGPTDAELRKAKNGAVVGYWKELETINAKASALGSYQMFRGDYHKLFSAPERYERVTRAEIRDLARRTFDEKNRTVGVLIPEKEQAAR